MKTLLTFVLCLFALVANAANPSTKSFRATGGLVVTSNDITGIITYDGSGISSPTGGVSATTVSNVVASYFANSTTNVVWVSKAGNDTTATRNSLNLPAQTVAKARDLAIAGDTVMVLPGTYYNATNLLKGYVNWFGFDGASLTYTNQTNTFDPGWGIFDDRFTGPVTSRVEGFSFIWNGGFPSTNSGGQVCCQNTNLAGGIVATNPRTRLTFKNARMDYASLYIGLGAVASKAGTNTFNWEDGIYDTYRTNYYQAGLDVDGDPVLVASEGIGLYWERGEVRFNARVLQGGHYSYWGHDTAPTNTAEIANAYINVDLYEGVFYVDGNGNSTYRTWAKGHEMICSLSGAVSPLSFINAGRVYLEGFGKITTSGLGMNGGTDVWISSQKMSSTANYFTVGGGTLNASVMHYDDLTSTIGDGILVQDGGKAIIHGGSMVLTSGRGLFLAASAGKVELKGVTIDTSSSTNSPILVQTNTLTMSGCTLINTNTRFSVTSGANATNTVRIYGSAGTTDVTNKVTVAVGPWTVDPLVQ